MPDWLINLGYIALGCLVVVFILACVLCVVGIMYFVKTEFMEEENRRKWLHGKTDRR